MLNGTVPIITLTSDLGESSHYPAIVKGIIYSMFPQARLVDVSHQVPDFDIMQAAYILRQIYPAYPKGSIHLISVDPDQASTMVMEYEGHHFVAPDNGVLSLISENEEVECWEVLNSGLIREDYPHSFSAARVLAPTAAFLASGGKKEEVGRTKSLKVLRWGDPSYASNCLRGKIIHIDKFGNAITNIQRSYFLELKRKRRFEIFIRNVRLQRIVNTYSDVQKADALAIFGGGDRLEIAMREASAADLLGLKLHDMITIEFRE
jgi:S-adenosylmethionine hydrolase